MNIIHTSQYTCTVREVNGFTSQSNSNSELAVDFGNGNVMTLNSCLSHLLNNKMIDWKEKKKAFVKGDNAKLDLIKKHYYKFQF